MKNWLYEKFKKSGEQDSEAFDLFQKFFDENLDLMCVLDLDRNFLRVNHSWTEVLGYTISDLETHKISDYVHDDDKKFMNFSAKDIEDCNEKFLFDIRYKSKKGKWKNLECTVQHFYDMFYISARDITDWEKTKILLKKSRAEMKRALRLQEMVSQFAFDLIVSKDFNTQIIDSISEICKFLQIDRFLLFLDEQDRHSSILRHSWQSIPTDKTLLLEEKIDYKAVSSYKLLLEKKGLIFSKDLENLPLDLKTHLIDNNVSSVAIFPLYVEGKIQGFTRFDCFERRDQCDDSTVQSLQTLNRIISSVYEKRIVHLRLNKRHDELDKFFANSKDGFVFLTLDKPIDWKNASNKQELMEYAFYNQQITKANDVICEQYGVTRDEFLALKPIDFYPNDIEKGKKIWTRLYETGFFHLDTEIIRPNGEKVVIKGYYMCLYDQEGRITGHFGVHRDITAERLAEEKIRTSEMRFTQLAENIEDIFWIRENNKMIYVNSAFEKITGIPKQTLLSGELFLHNLIIEEDKPIFFKEMNKSPSALNARYRIKRPDGEIKWIWDRGRTYLCPHTNIVRSVGVSSDITLMKELEEKLEISANIDGLTQIYNRKYVFDRLEYILDDYKKNSSTFSFAILDIDFFKNINDTFGHPAGDFILTDFSRIIKENIRKSDILGRYGGEEFVVVLQNTDKASSEIVMDKILNLIRRKIFKYEEESISFTFSCGISDASEFDKSTLSITQLVNCADERLYSAKRTGRDKIVIDNLIDK